MTSGIYSFIDLNINFFNFDNFKRHDSTNYLNLSKVDKLISTQSCGQEYYKLIKKIMSEVNYISFETYKEILTKNIDEIISYIQQDYIPIFITTNFNSDKSNIYYTLLTLKLLRDNGHIVDKFYNSLSDCMNKCLSKTINNDIYYYHNLEFPGKKLLLIITDDMFYTGNQMSNEVFGYFTKIKHNFDPDILIYFNLIGYTEYAKDYYDKLILSKDSIKFSSNAKTNHKTVNNLIDIWAREEQVTTEKYINKKDMYVISIYNSDIVINRLLLHGILNEIKDEHSKLTLTYLFHKYPDHVSTNQYLCNIIAEKDDYYIINLDELQNELQIDNIYDIIPFDATFNIDKIHDKIKTDQTLKQNIIDTLNDKKQAIKVSWIYKCNNTNIDDIYLTPKNSNSKAIIKILDNCDFTNKLTSHTYLSCNKNCIKPFYKSIMWKPFYNESFTFESLKQRTFPPLEPILRRGRGNTDTKPDTYETKIDTASFKQKYLKYKSKYLELKYSEM